MNALDFTALHGKPVAEVIAEAAGTTFSHYLHIAYGHRQPSIKLAKRLVAACADIPDTEHRLDLVSLLGLGD